MERCRAGRLVKSITHDMCTAASTHACAFVFVKAGGLLAKLRHCQGRCAHRMQSAYMCGTISTCTDGWVGRWVSLCVCLFVCAQAMMPAIPVIHTITYLYIALRDNTPMLAWTTSARVGTDMTHAAILVAPNDQVSTAIRRT